MSETATQKIAKVKVKALLESIAEEIAQCRKLLKGETEL